MSLFWWLKVAKLVEQSSAAGAMDEGKGKPLVEESGQARELIGSRKDVKRCECVKGMKARTLGVERNGERG